MSVASPHHLVNEALVSLVECLEFSFPPQRFRMMRVSFLMICQDAEDSVEFSMLTKQMITAEFSRRDVPDSHVRAILLR